MDWAHYLDLPIFRLLIALLLGAIIGTQRGWVYRHKASGTRIAGIRTFSLIGLMGGLCGLLADIFTPFFVGFALVALAVMVIVAFVKSQSVRTNLSITGLVGMLITFLLGCLAVVGDMVIAASAAVITALILDYKRELHAALQTLQEYELEAALRLLLISVVMLPLLPNKGLGPWQAINLYEIWWMVVLIASISFIGYFAIKIGGAKKGILFTCLFAGLSSSTALTVQFAHLSNQRPHLSALLASGILVSCGTMFPRILLLCSVLNYALVELLWLPMAVMMAGFYLPAIWIWSRNKVEIASNDSPEAKQNPLDLSSALFFGVVLLVIMLLSTALQHWFGDTGMYILAAISGITDVDAITLTFGRQSTSGLLLSTAMWGIFIAAAVNSLVKMGMAIVIGAAALARRVILPIIGSVLLGTAAVWFYSSQLIQ